MLMIAHALQDKPVLLRKLLIRKGKKKIFSSSALQQQHQNLREFILLVHGFSGCVFTSAIYGKGEKQLLKIFDSNAFLMEYVRVFNSTDFTANEIVKAEEHLFLFLYGATNYNISFDVVISDTSCFKNPFKRLHPSWSPCHQYLTVELSIHSAPTTKSRFVAATKSLFLNNGVGYGGTVFFNLLNRP